MEIKIRPAAASDAAVIAEFNILLAQESEGLKLEPACITAGVEALLADPLKGQYYVAEIAGAVVGQLMITYEWSDWRNANIWWLQSVFVREDYRGRGVFGGLCQHLQNLARQRPDVCTLRLYMHVHNERARRAYERHGFQKTYYEVLESEVVRA